MADRKVTVLEGADGNDYDVMDDAAQQKIGTTALPTTAQTLTGAIAELHTNKVPNTRKVNDKALSADVTLTGSDIPVSSSDSKKIDTAFSDLKSALNKSTEIAKTTDYVLQFGVEIGRVNSSGTVDSTYPVDRNYRTTEFIPVEPDGIYLFKTNETVSVYTTFWCTYDENKSLLNYGAIDVRSNPYQWTTPTGVSYLRFSISQTIYNTGIEFKYKTNRFDEIEVVLNNAVAQVSGLTSSALKAIGATGGDLNDLQNNTIVNINSAGLTVESNHVPYDNFNGTVITLCGVSNQTVIRCQLAISGGNGANYYWRQCYTSWNSWNKIATIDDINSAVHSITPLDILPTFSNITCCGDSLTQSVVYTGDTTYRQAITTYPQVLSKITGTPVTAFATGGYTAANWWNAYANEITEKTNQVAIIYLGTNGGLTDTLSTDAPENADPSTWANTNTGCYAKIIAKFKSVGAKVILVKTYAGPSHPIIDTTNDVLTQMADRFHCGIVNNVALSDSVYTKYPTGTGTGYPHYNDLGYCAFARYLSNQIAKMDTNYLKYLIPGSE